MSDKQKIHRWLLEGPVCSLRFYTEGPGRGAARIADLKRDGLNIESKPCVKDWHRHNGKRYVEYTLVPPDRLF